MVITVQSLLTLAKAYANDDHAQVSGAVPDATWLLWANIEWRYVYQLLLDYSLIAPATALLTAVPVDGQIALTGCLGILHVSAVVDSDGRRRLSPVQAEEGRYPFRTYTGTGQATEWWAEGSGGAVTVTVNPSDSSETYEIRYVAEPPELVLTAPGAGQVSSVDVNPLAADLLAMRMANKYAIRYGAQSGNLLRTIESTTAELNMHSVARHQGAHTVRNVDTEVRGWYKPRANWYF